MVRPTVSICDGSSSLSVLNNHFILGADCREERVNKLRGSRAGYAKVTCATEVYCSRIIFNLLLTLSSQNKMFNRKREHTV